jgi:hypothetical protein
MMVDWKGRVWLTASVRGLDPLRLGWSGTAHAATLEGRLERFLGKSPNEIGTADDANNPSITYHRNTLYAVRGQKPRDLPKVRLLSYSDYWAYHDVTYQTVRSTQAREEIGVQHLALGKKHQPPIPASLEIRCIAAD